MRNSWRSAASGPSARLELAPQRAQLPLQPTDLIDERDDVAARRHPDEPHGGGGAGLDARARGALELPRRRERVHEPIGLHQRLGGARDGLLDGVERLAGEPRDPHSDVVVPGRSARTRAFAAAPAGRSVRVLGVHALDTDAARAGVDARGLDEQEGLVLVVVELLRRFPDLEDLDLVVAVGGVVKASGGLVVTGRLELGDDAFVVLLGHLGGADVDGNGHATACSISRSIPRQQPTCEATVAAAPPSRRSPALPPVRGQEAVVDLEQRAPLAAREPLVVLDRLARPGLAVRGRLGACRPARRARRSTSPATARSRRGRAPTARAARARSARVIEFEY